MEVTEADTAEVTEADTARVTVGSDTAVDTEDTEVIE